MRSVYRTAKWRRARAARLRLDEGRCVRCGQQESLHVDHIIPVKAGGDLFASENLQTLCIRCHGQKSGADRRAAAGLKCDPTTGVKYRR